MFKNLNKIYGPFLKKEIIGPILIIIGGILATIGETIFEPNYTYPSIGIFIISFLFSSLSFFSSNFLFIIFF